MIVDGQRLSRDELRAVRRRFAALPRELKAELRKAQRDQVGAIWKAEMAKATPPAGGLLHMQHVVFRSGTRVKAGLPIVLVAGGSTKRLSGGGSAADLARPMEFGTGRRDRLTRYRRRTPSGSTVVTRHASKQLRLTRRQGYVVHPAVSQTVPRVIGLWVNTIAKRILDALEGK